MYRVVYNMSSTCRPSLKFEILAIDVLDKGSLHDMSQTIAETYLGLHLIGHKKSHAQIDVSL